MADTTNALSQAANNLDAVNKDAATTLRQAANALRQSNNAGIATALKQAASALNQQQKQMDNTALSKAACQAAQRVNAAQQNVAQAGQPDRPENPTAAEPKLP